MPNAATILAYAAISQYLSSNEYAKKLALKGGSNAPLKRLSRLIYITRKAVDFDYQRDSTDPTLVSTGNYLYWLCGKFNAIAANLINGGGSGTIVNPATGTSSTIVAYNLQFVVGEVGSPMTNGETSLIIALDGFIENSIDVALDGIDLPQNRNDRISFTVDYSNPSQVTITWNQGVIDGQLYEIKGLRLQAVVPPAPSETFFTVEAYSDMRALATGLYYREFLVLNDENKGLERTSYQFWPGTPDRIEWIAATNEV